MMKTSQDAVQFEERWSAMSGEASWLLERRRQAADAFKQKGWPGKRDESWRFTKTKLVNNLTFIRPDGDRKALVPANESMQQAICAQLVFLDGNYAPGLSSRDLPSGVEVMPFAAFALQEPERAQSLFASQVTSDADAFAALNTALFEGGVYLRISARAKIEKPLLVTYVAGGGHTPYVLHPRLTVELEEGAQLTLVEHFHSPQGSAHLTNATSELFLNEGAYLNHVYDQRECGDSYHLGKLGVWQARDSRYTSSQLLLGGSWCRREAQIRLAGRGADCELNGLMMGQNTQHLDFQVKVIHAEPNCRSRQFVKGILDGKACGVFTGKVVVEKHAQKTDAGQSCRTLLLSDDARIHTQPQLEIYADDVKCAHGATTGHLDEDGLYYLQTRGLDRETARQLLIYGFAHEVLERVPCTPVRNTMEHILHERFRKTSVLEEA